MAERGDLLLDVGEVPAVGVAHHRHHQPLLGADRDADVVMVLVDDVLAVDLGIDRRQFLQRDDRRLDEDRHEAEAHPVLFLECLAPAFAQRDGAAHIDFVEGRQHRRILLRLLEALGDTPSQPGHPHPGFPVGGRWF